MPYYDGCRIHIQIPAHYLDKEKLTKFFEAEYPGCLIIAEEDAKTQQPTVDEAFVPETSPLS
jgi:hypothetical protein